MKATRIKLGELCHVVTKGTTPTSVGLAFSESGVPFLRIQNLGDRTVDLSDVLYIDDATNLALNRSRIKPKDFLITIAGTIGKVAIVPDDFPECNCNQAVAILRFDYERLAPQYLLHWLATNDAFDQISGRKVTATISNLSLGQIKELKIPLPPLAEQQKIAAILDAADGLRQKDQQLIDHYTTLSQSLFLEMFGDPVTNSMGWNVKKLGDISKKITDGEHQNPPVADKGMNLIMAKDVLGDRVDFSKPRYVNDEDYNKYIKKCNPENGDVLLVSRGATVGRCTVVNTNIPFCLMGSVILLKPDINILGLYISYIFKHHNFSKRLVNVSSASAQQAIYINHLKKLIIPSPPIELQNLFADRIAIIEKQKQQAKASLEKSNALFNSLLQRAFNGELTGNKAA